MDNKIPTLDQHILSGKEWGGAMVAPLGEYLKTHDNLVFPHRHDFYHFVYFTDGGGYYSIDFKKFDVVPNQMYFMSPGQIHSWSFESNIQGFVCNFDVDFFKTFLFSPDYISVLSFFSGLVGSCVVDVDKKDRAIIVDLFQRLIDLEEDGGGRQKDLLRVTLLHLLLKVESRTAKQKQETPIHYNHTILRNYITLVEENYTTLRLPKEYAALLYITPNHLNALCKEYLGKQAGEIIRERILLEAKRMLAVGGYTISEIAFALNFTDNSYFSKFFKKSEGVTPENFRKYKL